MRPGSEKNQEPLRISPWQHYWADYGGWKAIFTSKEILISSVFVVCIAPLWLKSGWWEDVISITPSMLSFSLAAYAMIIGFGNDRLMKAITTPIVRQNSDSSAIVSKPSAYASTSAAFVHFIVIQTLALAAALFCKAWHVPEGPVEESFLMLDTENGVTYFGWYLSYTIFVYSVVCGLSATMRLFTLKRWYALAVQIDVKEAEEKAARDAWEP